MPMLGPRNVLVFVAFVAPLVVSVPARAADWSQWQGDADRRATRTDAGIFQSGETGPLELVELWRKPFGSGYAALAVGQGVIVSAMANGSGDDVAIGIDAESGKTLWRVRLEETYEGHDGSHDGPLASPAILGDTAYALGARGRLVALAVADGTIRWETHLKQDHGAKPPHYGFAASPLAADGKVVVQGDGKRGRTLFAFDAESGRLLWKSGTEKVRYGSPSLMLLAGERQVVVAGLKGIVGVALESGEERWRHAMKGGDFTPVPIGRDRVFAIGEEDAIALRISKDGDVFVPEIAWRNPSADLDGPAAFEEGALYAQEGDDIVCLDAESGAIRWRHAAENGTLARVDGHIALIEYGGGQLRIVRAPATGPPVERGLFALLDQNQSLVGPTADEGQLPLRSRKEIVAVRFRPAAAGDQP